jgi:integrase
MAKRDSGTGCVVQLKHKDKKTGEIVKSRYYYILYRVGGRRIRESSGSESKQVAEQLLQRRLGEAGLGLKPQQDVKNLKYEEVRDAYLAEARNKGLIFCQKKNGTEYFNGVQHLDAFFAGMRVVNINSDLLRQFIETRRKEGAADPTIRRNLAVLRAMLNQARKEGKLRLADIPHFPMPQDSKPRQGFVTPDVFEKLRLALPENLRPLVAFMYYTGCRKGAAQQIVWSMISADCKEVELPGEITKTGEPLTLPLAGAGLNEITKLLKKMFRKSGPVFDATNLRQEWCRACHDLGLGVYDVKTRRYSGLTIHDLRRSAVRNLTRAGVPRGIAMAITGHKTEHVFERYNIVNTDDVREALVRLGEYAKIQRRAAQKQPTQRAKVRVG